MASSSRASLPANVRNDDDAGGQEEEKAVVDEVYGFIVVYEDGTVHRPTFPGGFLPAGPYPPHLISSSSTGGTIRVASKDVIIDPANGVWARLFLPVSTSASRRRAPVVLHFHGGGLCSGSASAAAFHKFCSKMAAGSHSIWISVDYRLAPEHRLPAAYDDAFAAFLWLHRQASLSHCGYASPRNARVTESKDSNRDSDLQAGLIMGLHNQISQDNSGCDMDQVSREGTGSGMSQVSQGSGRYESSQVNTASGMHQVSQENIESGMHPQPPHQGSLDKSHIDMATLSDQTPSEDVALEPWLRDHADFSNCFIAGESSGAAITHYLATRLVHRQWGPIHIQGLLLVHAAFLIDEVFAPAFFSNSSMERRPNTYRRLALLPGSDLDHPLTNPLHPQAPSIKDAPMPPCVVAVAEQDVLSPAVLHYAKAMQDYGHDVDLYVTPGLGHCFHLMYPKREESELLYKHLIKFILDHCVPSQSQSSL